MKHVICVAIAALVAAPLFAAEGGSAGKFAQEFGKHWATARDLTLAVADAMPAENYTFKPNPEEMSFGEQMVHIAGANFSYCSRISGAKSPFTKPEKSDKETAQKVLSESFSYCSDAVSNAGDVDTMRGPEGKQISEREIMLGAYAHMAHHRGQAEVYLRLKNIKPPTYKF